MAQIEKIDLLPAFTPLPKKLKTSQMGHGTHWEAVLNNLHEDFPRVLDSGITSGHVIGRQRKPAWHGPVGIEEAEITLIQAAESGFGTLGAVVKDSSRNYLHTAFPIATRGQTHRIRIADAHESSFGLEARITAEIGEAKITFFEPYYVLNSGKYRPGVELDVILVGIVYRLQVADRNETVIHPQIGETHLGGAAMSSVENSSAGIIRIVDDHTGGHSMKDSSTTLVTSMTLSSMAPLCGSRSWDRNTGTDPLSCRAITATT